MSDTRVRDLSADQDEYLWISQHAELSEIVVCKRISRISLDPPAAGTRYPSAPTDCL